jgi:flagellar motor switch/type III secretory pathway protein FliN
MSVPRPLWSVALPRYSRGVARLRHRIALDAWRPGGPWHARHDQIYRFENAEPLPTYPLWLTLHSALGTLKFGLDAATLFPEINGEVIGSFATDEDRREALEWLLMPWLDGFEALTGCECRIAATSVEPAAPSPDSAAFRVVLRGGRMAHAIVSGSALDYLVDAMGVPLPPPPAWCRVVMTWALRVEALSPAEMSALTQGAMLLLRAARLQASTNKGVLRMQAHWQDDDTAALDGVAETRTAVGEALVDIDELSFDIDVVLARESLTLNQVRELCKGAVLPLAKPVDGQQVSLACNGRAFARGHIVYVADSMAVMITECREV